MGRTRRIRPRDYLVTDRFTQQRFGFTRNVLWWIPEAGTQTGCAAAQLQHNVARALREMVTDHTTVKEFCRRFQLDYMRIRSVLSGDKAMSFEDVAVLLSRAQRLEPDGLLSIELATVLATPEAYDDPVPKILKTWPANAATAATWAAARERLQERVVTLLAQYLPWAPPTLTIIADADPEHAEQPASGFVDSRKAELTLYLDENWKTDVLEAGHLTRAGFPVIAMELDHERRPQTLTCLDLERIGDNEYEFISRIIDY